MSETMENIEVSEVSTGNVESLTPTQESAETFQSASVLGEPLGFPFSVGQKVKRTQGGKLSVKTANGWETISCKGEFISFPLSAINVDYPDNDNPIHYVAVNGRYIQKSNLSGQAAQVLVDLKAGKTAEVEAVETIREGESDNGTQWKVNKAVSLTA